MYINRFKNKEVFIRAGGKYLEIFNSDGVIFLFKMFKYFAVINFVWIDVTSLNWCYQFWIDVTS